MLHTHIFYSDVFNSLATVDGQMTVTEFIDLYRKTLRLYTNFA